MIAGPWFCVGEALDQCVPRPLNIMSPIQNQADGFLWRIVDEQGATVETIWFGRKNGKPLGAGLAGDVGDIAAVFRAVDRIKRPGGRHDASNRHGHRLPVSDNGSAGSV